MTLNLDGRADWRLGVVGLAVGSFGAFIESWLLSGDLNHRYPFKIMNTPPPDYYVSLANTIESFAPYLALLVGLVALILVPRHKIVAGLIPVILCPLVYIVGLWYLVSNGPYRENLNDIVNFDSTSAAMRHQEFYSGAIGELLFSVVVYLVFVLFSLGFHSLLQRRALV